MSAAWLVSLSVLRSVCVLLIICFLGRGPKAADGLCFHMWENYSSVYLSVSPTKISAWWPKPQPCGPNSIFGAQISSLRPEFQP